MIGNAADAKFIRDYVIAKKKEARRPNWCCEACDGPLTDEFAKVELPEGWREIGSGLYRTAYLSPDGVIYKVESNYDTAGSWGQSNYGEYENILRVILSGKKVKSARLPKATLFMLDGKTVMAMEFIDGQRPNLDCYQECRCTKLNGRCNREAVEEIGRSMMVSDLHDGNIAWLPKQNEYVIMDVGASI
jgi:hypothetical protein